MPNLTRLIAHSLRGLLRQNSSPADGTSHQLLPIERPDVIIAAVRDVLAPDPATQKTSTRR
jgi:hypothetical protein